MFNEDDLKSLFSNMTDSITKENVEFIYVSYTFIESHLSRLFATYEGHACSADKSRTIVNSLVRHFKTKEDIEFDYSAEYTSHLPKNILKEHGQIISFYEGMKGLMCGSPDKYLLS